MPHTTRLLSSVATKARAERRLFAPPASHFVQVTDTYAEVWFPTGGCLWDSLGHCTTCNYGAPQPVTADAMVRAVEIAVAQLAPTTQTLWVSAFDTLQTREVPDDARRRIFTLLGEAPANKVITETHPASVRPQVVAECVELLAGRTLGIELGVETMDEFVRFACVNKPFTNSRLSQAVAAIHGAGAEAWANLIVGIPFLDRAEIVEGTVDSIRKAAALGFDAIVLFPNHVKEHTIAYALAGAGWYAPPDLWVLRDVLAAVPTELIDRIHLAWLDIKPHPGAPRVAFEPERQATVHLRTLLDRFDLSREPRALQEALALTPPQRPLEDSHTHLLDRLLTQYEWLAHHHGERDWWETYAPQVKAELAAGLANSSISTPKIRIR